MIYARKGASSVNATGVPGPSGEPSAIGTALSGTTSADKATDALISGLHNTPAVTYEDLANATGGFSSNKIIGRGGYGVVYRGLWKHTQVAIKRIQGKSGGDERHQRERIRQSLQELKTLAKFRHDNVLSLYGYSLDGPEPCLVYQFMSNGTLEDRLLCRNGTKPLSWANKLCICEGVCRGLHFLHTIDQMPIIHGDVKSANILLDKHFEPKLGDFGLSRDGQVELEISEKKPMIASHVKGTLAYLAPEFLTSFGVVLLEVATGLRAFSSSRNPQGIVEFVLKVCKSDVAIKENCFSELADKRTPKTEEGMNLRVFDKLLSVGVTCTQKDRFARPIFSEIFAQLNEDS
uniref:non-specific serine/threonine protein kinase n=1 Tax=Globodera pallida TaxID=36090 RepID=A0A183CHQ3_GLOPA